MFLMKNIYFTIFISLILHLIIMSQLNFIDKKEFNKKEIELSLNLKTFESKKIKKENYSKKKIINKNEKLKKNSAKANKKIIDNNTIKEMNLKSKLLKINKDNDHTISNKIIEDKKSKTKFKKSVMQMESSSVNQEIFREEFNINNTNDFRKSSEKTNVKQNKNEIAEDIKKIIDEYLKNKNPNKYYPIQAIRRKIEGDVFFKLIIRNKSIKIENYDLKNIKSDKLIVNAGLKYIENNLKEINEILSKKLKNTRDLFIISELKLEFRL